MPRRPRRSRRRALRSDHADHRDVRLHRTLFEQPRLSPSSRRRSSRAQKLGSTRPSRARRARARRRLRRGVRVGRSNTTLLARSPRSRAPPRAGGARSCRRRTSAAASRMTRSRPPSRAPSTTCTTRLRHHRRLAAAAARAAGARAALAARRRRAPRRRHLELGRAAAAAAPAARDRAHDRLCRRVAPREGREAFEEPRPRAPSPASPPRRAACTSALVRARRAGRGRRRLRGGVDRAARQAVAAARGATPHLYLSTLGTANAPSGLIARTRIRSRPCVAVPC